MENKPRPYDINNPAELRRLFRECWGYLNACKSQHHGTDFTGREYAMVALKALQDAHQ